MINDNLVTTKSQLDNLISDIQVQYQPVDGLQQDQLQHYTVFPTNPVQDYNSNNLKLSDIQITNNQHPFNTPFVNLNSQTEIQSIYIQFTMKKLISPTKYFFQQAQQENTEPDPVIASKIDKLVSNLVNTQQCPLCKKQYVADFKSSHIPRILIHCGHTFCHGCLTQFYMKRRVRCPMCLKLVKHLDSLQQLPVNHTIFTKVFERTQKDPQQSSRSLLFGEFQRAQKAALLLNAPPKYDPTSGLPFCPFHSDRVEHFYCETHKATGCRICSQVGHNNPECNVLDLYMIEDPNLLSEIFGKFSRNQEPQIMQKNPKNTYKNKVIGDEALWIQNNLNNLDDLDEDEHRYSV